MDEKTVSDFVVHVQSILNQGGFDAINELINTEETVAILQASAWDLVPKVCDFLTGNTNEKPGLVQCCDNILMRLCEVGNVKELLLALLEQTDCFIDDTRYVTLLGPIQKCLLSFPGQKGPSLAVALETIYAQLQTLQKPDFQQVGTKEGRVLMENDDNVRRIVYLIGEVLHFFHPFVDKVAKSPHEKKLNKQRKDLTFYLIKMLDYPMCYLDYSVEVDASDNKTVTKSSGCVLAEKLVNFTANMNENLSSLLEQLQLTNERNKIARSTSGGDEELNVEEVTPLMGMAMLAYLVIGESIGTEMLPQVFTAVHWLLLTRDYILMMLKRQDLVIVVKGLDLLNGVLVKSQAVSIGSQVMLWNDCCNLIDALMHVMATSQEKEVTQMAVKAFGFLYKKLDYLFRYKTITFVFHKCSHSGILGYAVTLLKDEINFCMNAKANSVALEFRNGNLVKLLRFLFTLPEQETTNLLEKSEYIMGGLNLLRYLVLRDKPSVNSTGVWDLMPDVEAGYLEHIRKALTLSRAHYELDLNKVKQGKHLTGEGVDEVAFTVGGENMPGMTKEQKMHVLQLALHTFDMMDSVVGRVMELVDQARKS